MEVRRRFATETGLCVFSTEPDVSLGRARQELAAAAGEDPLMPSHDRPGEYEQERSNLCEVEGGQANNSLFPDEAADYGGSGADYSSSSNPALTSQDQRGRTVKAQVLHVSFTGGNDFKLLFHLINRSW